MQNFGRIAPRDRECMREPINVIACNKREAFVQGSEATRQSISPREEGLDCFASLAMTAEGASGLFDIADGELRYAFPHAYFYFAWGCFRNFDSAAVYGSPLREDGGG